MGHEPRPVRHGTSVPATRASGRLVASWLRSQEYGVSREAVEPAFTGSLDEESLFFQCGREVLTGPAPRRSSTSRSA